MSKFLSAFPANLAPKCRVVRQTLVPLPSRINSTMGFYIKVERGTKVAGVSFWLGFLVLRDAGESI